jgi:hypothetical protein
MKFRFFTKILKVSKKNSISRLHLIAKSIIVSNKIASMDEDVKSSPNAKQFERKGRKFNVKAAVNLYGFNSCNVSEKVQKQSNS